MGLLEILLAALISTIKGFTGHTSKSPSQAASKNLE